MNFTNITRKEISAVTGLMLLAFLMPFISCQKKWKKTTTVNFEFTVIPATGHHYLEFHSGYMNLKQFTFRGTRKKGADVEFSSQIPEGTQVNISSLGAASITIPYDIPQGAYNDIDIKVDVSGGNAQDAKIYVSGIFRRNNQFSYPVLLKIKTSELFEVQARHADGTSEIVLVEGKPGRALVSFDMSNWFSNVTRNMMENAGIDSGVININSEQNTNIYDVIIGRIRNSCKVVFL